MLDADQSAISDVTTPRLKEQVRRNHDRFPEGFAFEPAQEERDEERTRRANEASVYEPYGLMEEWQGQLEWL
jgi:hypothetical protein